MKPEGPVIRWVVTHTLGDRSLSLPSPELWRSSLDDLLANRAAALAHHLLGPDLAALSPPTRVVLANAAARGAMVVSRTRLQLRELATRLDADEIPWVVQKGLPLAERLYPTATCRPGRDVDVLVAPAAFREAEAVLVALGYHQGHVGLEEVRYERPGPEGWTDAIDLHWAAAPAPFGGPGVEQILAGRRRYESQRGGVWLPAPEVEIDLLCRHYAKHAGWQAVLVLDLLLYLAGGSLDHEFGGLIGDDLERLGLPRTISGPSRWRQAPLRFWMRRRRFADRLWARVPPKVQIGFALADSLGSWLGYVRRSLWPEKPSPRWRPAATTGWGRYTWRLRRLIRLGAP